MPGEEVGPLAVQVLSPPIRGVPGRSGSRDPAVGASVRFEVRDIEDGAPSPVLVVRDVAAAPAGEIDTKRTALSDQKGHAQAWVRLPKAIGEWRVRAGISDQFADDKTVAFQIVSGLRIYQSGQENSVDRKVQVAVQVFQVDRDGQVSPHDRLPVQFEIDEPPGGGARLGGDRLADRIRANPDGVAVADLILGGRSGTYRVLATPKSDTARSNARP